ncbi:hypothetical protein BGZ60DRAFT_520077 [Tricladium varicosporioides]|nr:hypothetical protein BGZ60DRAFT_520077 [Hymenoscyphus varicosporioides]
MIHLLSTSLLFAHLTLIAAQQMPACASTCLGSVPPQCGSTDISCICLDSSFSVRIGCCAAARCSAADMQSNSTVAGTTTLISSGTTTTANRTGTQKSGSVRRIQGTQAIVVDDYS